MKLYKSFCPCHPHLWLWNMDPAWWLKKGSRLSKPSAWGNLSATWCTRPTTGCEARCGSTGISSSSYQQTETCMVRACHMPWQPPQNHLSGHIGGWAMPWSAEEMLDGQHQRVNIPAHARTAHKVLPRKDQKRISAESSLMSPWWSNRSMDWTELNCGYSKTDTKLSFKSYSHTPK